MYEDVLSSGSLSGVQGMNSCAGMVVPGLVVDIWLGSCRAGWCLNMVMTLVVWFSFMLHNSMLSSRRRVFSALFRSVRVMYPISVDVGLDSFVPKGFSISSTVVLITHDVATVSIAAVIRVVRVAGSRVC